jgi:hypothetical protein
MVILQACAEARLEAAAVAQRGVIYIFERTTLFWVRAGASWRKWRFLFYKCKNFKWFPLLVDTGRFCRLWGGHLRFAPRKTGDGNEGPEDGRRLISFAGVGDRRIGFLFASSVARRVKCFGWFWGQSG